MNPGCRQSIHSAYDANCTVTISLFLFGSRVGEQWFYFFTNMSLTLRVLIPVADSFTVLFVFCNFVRQAIAVVIEM